MRTGAAADLGDCLCTRTVDWLPPDALAIGAGSLIHLEMQPGTCHQLNALSLSSYAARRLHLEVECPCSDETGAYVTPAGLGGGIVWEAATVLTRFLATSRRPCADADDTKRILDLGSGTGVCGLVAAAQVSGPRVFEHVKLHPAWFTARLSFRSLPAVGEKPCDSWAEI
jgi:hypothetical protein